ncbi:T9SS type A sorting domain-containing protein [Pontibacter sp. FD36]|uniref:T9SS type A sorting domain-containing protein n=1 Tax=Pontibacter sp. FD36 TaxID=2789860 RepID=UPI0018AAC917|nr:T9SS type A sorting domain-containing protein [Pontibacter sp. FD36]MBF8965464.1 T9SS type A sorting domain-containing protein [Pontibacter sp. FD36]
MNKVYYCHLFTILFLLCCSNKALAQTPGLIYKPATAGGARVLDPNGDGYVSVARTPAGFTGTRDEGAGFSEVPYRPFPALTTEPLGDINTGAMGGHTDLAPPNYAGSTGSPIAAYFNGSHLLFRVRLGGASTASKGYSVLMDANNQFGDLVEGGSLSTTPNPGFEYEVVLAANFDVSIYDHRGKASGGTKVWSGSADQFSQKAVAASTAGGNADYFYDFYVPLSAFPTTGPAVLTADTPLRLSGITVTSAQSGISGTVADVGGVNFSAYELSKQRAWQDIINSFPPTSLNQLRSGEFAKIVATPPVVTGPILAGSTSIIGRSTEAAGSTITVYRTRAGATTSIGTASVTANGSWSVTGLASSLLLTGDKITAIVSPTIKNSSPASAEVTVTAPAACTAIPAPTLTGQTNSSTKYAVGTTQYVGRQRISLYTVTVNNGVYAFALQGSYVFTATTAPAALPTAVTSMENVTGTMALSKAGNYVVTTTPVDANGAATGCESFRSNQMCFQNGGTAPVNNHSATITSATGSTGLTYATLSELPAGITSLSGTLSSYVAGMSVIVAKNGSQTAFRASVTSTNWTVNTTGLALAPGDILFVRVEASSACGVNMSAASNLAVIRETTAAPVINPIPTCGFVKSVSGTSAEPGSVVTLFTNGTTTNLTSVVASTGAWTIDVSSLNNGSGIAAGVPITARAKTAGKATSIFSNTVFSSAAPALPSGATFTINPVAEPLPGEQLVTIRGRAPASTADTKYEVTLSVAGTPFATVATTSTGTWEVAGISSLEIYTGAVLSATFKSNASNCSSGPVTTTVQCRPPSNTYMTTLSATSVCYNGTVTVTLSGSERGVSYRLTNNGTPTGASVAGTGSAITLTSGPLAASTSSLSVRAVDVGSDCATTGIGGNKAVTVLAAPPQPTALVASTPTGCAAVTTNLSLNSPVANTTYQLINFDTKAFIGSPVVVGATAPASVTLATNYTLYGTTTFGVRITPTAGCASESIRTATVTVTEGPSLAQAVTLDKPTPCAGEQVTISVATEYNSAYTYTIRDNTGTTIGASFPGTGNVVSRTTVYPGGVTTSRSFYVEVTGGCATNVRMTTTVTATPSTAAVQAFAGGAREVCGAFTLEANYASPGTGTWSMEGGVPAGASFSSLNDPKATVTGLPSGVHTLRWTINTACGGQSTTSSSTVQITVNCPAHYLIHPPRYAAQYKSGDLLATATDPDGGIRAAAVVNGGLPEWVQLLSNGNIEIRTGFTPLAGTYSLTIRTTDGFNNTSDTPLTLTVYGEPPLITPLPVELVYFRAKAKQGMVVLEWKTASEKDNKQFLVERSQDAKAFVPIGEVAGKGTTVIAQHYSFTDKSALAGVAYYRLRQEDFDGKHEYSRVVAINRETIADHLRLQVYPNPFTSVLSIAYQAEAEGKATVRLVSLRGQTILTKELQLHRGLNELELSVPSLNGGVYLLHFRGDGLDKNLKIMKY